MNIKLDQNTISPRLRRMMAEAQGAGGILEAGTKEVQETVAAHLAGLQARGGKLSGPLRGLVMVATKNGARIALVGNSRRSGKEQDQLFLRLLPIVAREMPDETKLRAVAEAGMVKAVRGMMKVTGT